MAYTTPPTYPEGSENVTLPQPTIGDEVCNGDGSIVGRAVAFEAMRVLVEEIDGVRTWINRWEINITYWQQEKPESESDRDDD